MYLLSLTFHLERFQEPLTQLYGDIEHWDFPMLQGLDSQFQTPMGGMSLLMEA